MSRSPDDLDDARLDAWLAGDLPDDESAAIAERVAADDDLAARARRLRELQSLEDEMRDAFGGDVATTRASGTRATGDVDPLELSDYDVLGELARGGQGVVLRARQRSTSRDVALKILAAQGAPDRALRRFDREVELVASLSHPHVVRVFDRGVAPDGRMYVVMELVDGEPIDRWVDERDPPLERRLVLFDAVCSAVAFAHRHGVIHRDIKPANILVDESGEPRVLDFGLAKLEGEGRSMLTQAGEFLGTLAWAAPEQLRGDPDAVDTRADVHALGLLLFRLLTGEHAFPVDGAPASVVRHVAETEPSPPSRMRHEVDEDLDAVVLTCLEKDPERRYATVEALRADLARRRNGEPLVARSDRRGYLLRRTLRRYRVPLAALAVVFAALVTATVVSLSALADTRRQAARAHDLGTFLSESLTAATPGLAPRDRTVVELMQQAARDVAGRFPDDPASEGVIRTAIAQVLEASGEWDAAVEHAERARDLLVAELGPRSREALRARSLLAQTAVARGDFDAAEEAFSILVDDAARALPAHDVERIAIVRAVAELRMAQGRGGEAADVLREAVAAREAHAGADDLEVLAARHSLAEALRGAGRLDEALAILEDVEAARARLLGDDHGRTLTTRHNRANLLAQVERLDEAIPLYADVAERYAAQAGEDVPATLQARSNLAAALHHARRSDEARDLYVPLLATARDRLGPRHPISLQIAHGLGTAAKSLREYDLAAEVLEQVVEGRREVLGVDHPDTIGSTIELAVALGPTGPLERVEELLRDSVERARRVLGDDSSITLSARHALAVLLVDTRRPEEAVAIWDEIVPRSLEALGEDDWRVWNYTGQLGLTQLNLGEIDAGAENVERAWEGLSRTRGQSSSHARAMAQLMEQVARMRGDDEGVELWAGRSAAAP